MYDTFTARYTSIKQGKNMRKLRLCIKYLFIGCTVFFPCIWLIQSVVTGSALDEIYIVSSLQYPARPTVFLAGYESLFPILLMMLNVFFFLIAMIKNEKKSSRFYFFQGVIIVLLCVYSFKILGLFFYATDWNWTLLQLFEDFDFWSVYIGVTALGIIDILLETRGQLIQNEDVGFLASRSDKKLNGIWRHVKKASYLIKVILLGIILSFSIIVSFFGFDSTLWISNLYPNLLLSIAIINLICSGAYIIYAILKKEVAISNSWIDLALSLLIVIESIRFERMISFLQDTNSVNLFFQNPALMIINITLILLVGLELTQEALLNNNK